MQGMNVGQEAATIGRQENMGLKIIRSGQQKCKQAINVKMVPRFQVLAKNRILTAIQERAYRRKMAKG